MCGNESLRILCCPLSLPSRLTLSTLTHSFLFVSQLYTKCRIALAPTRDSCDFLSYSRSVRSCLSVEATCVVYQTALFYAVFCPCRNICWTKLLCSLLILHFKICRILICDGFHLRKYDTIVLVYCSHLVSELAVCLHLPNLHTRHQLFPVFRLKFVILLIVGRQISLTWHICSCFGSLPSWKWPHWRLQCCRWLLETAKGSLLASNHAITVDAP